MKRGWHLECMLVNIKTTFNIALSMTQCEHKFADIPKIWVYFFIHVNTKKLINTHDFFIKTGKFSFVTFDNLLKKVIKLLLALSPCFAVICFLL